MAKCVQVNGKAIRVSDDEAKRIVAAGGKYITKDEWKRATRPAEPAQLAAAE